MAGLTPIDLTELNAAVAEAVGVFASVNTYIDGVEARMSAAVAAAVTAAVDADNAIDKETIIDVAQAAIREQAAQLKAEAEKTAAALTENQPPRPEPPNQG